MDADHSGTVTEAEARKALKNRMPPVTSTAGNGEKISMDHGGTQDPNLMCVSIEAEVDKLVQTLMGWGARKNLPVLLENDMTGDW